MGSLKKALVVLSLFTFVVSIGGFEIAEARTNKETPKTIKNEQTSIKKDESEKQPQTVKMGMRGEIVREIQKMLTEAGYSVGTIDGIFGGQTQSGVQQFQMMHGLVSDGVVGQETLNALYAAKPVVTRGMRSLNMAASGYSAYDPGNSQYTTTGSLVRKGLVAVDPNVIPLGTRLFIPGYGPAVADDVGGAIKGYTIDLAFDSHNEALMFGRQDIVVYIIE